MTHLERHNEEPYDPTWDMTDEEYEAYCARLDREEGERDEYYDRIRKERRER